VSDAIKKLHDYLAMSPSVVYPEDVLEYLPAIDDENSKLRELLLDCWEFSHLMHRRMAARYYELGLIGCDEARKLGVEVDE
jgi:hypothetical protein